MRMNPSKSGLMKSGESRKDASRCKEQVLGLRRFEWVFSKFVNSDPPVLFFPNTDEGRQPYLDQSTAFWDEIKKKTSLDYFFGILPKADLGGKAPRHFREPGWWPQPITPRNTKWKPTGGLIMSNTLRHEWGHAKNHQWKAVAYSWRNTRSSTWQGLKIAQELESVPQYSAYARWGFMLTVEGWVTLTTSEAWARKWGQ